MRRSLLVLLAIASPLVPLHLVAAAETAIIAEGRYVMADGDTLAVAEERVLLRAQRRAIEEAGLYLEAAFLDSEKSIGGTSIQNSTLEIRTIAAAITKTVILESRRSFEQDRPSFYVRIRALVDVDNLKHAVLRWKSEQQLAAHFWQLQKENAQLKAQLQDLQTRPPGTRMIAIEPTSRARSAERAKTLVERALATEDLRHKLDLTSQAAELDPGSPDALVARGQTYLRLVSIAVGDKLPPKNYSLYLDNARMDFDRALILDPKNAWGLLGQGDVNTWLQRPDVAATAYRQVLILNPFFDVARERLINLHTAQARRLAHEKQWSRALALLDGLLTQPMPHSWIPSAKEAYLLRSELYQRLNQPIPAMKDLNTVLQVDPSHAQALLARAKLYRKGLQGIQAQEDFEHACILGATEACQQLP
jgi:tetratricopeptide (TPR) repeat protein